MSTSLPLVPYPGHVVDRSDSYQLPAMVLISSDDRFAAEATLLTATLAKILPSPPTIAPSRARSSIRLEFEAGIKSTESYKLTIGGGGIVISAASAAGVFYGSNTLYQLIHAALIEGRAELPGVEITDHPQFGWRGLMLDVSRHFYSADQVCRLLDLMALYKLNVFHWHLTDDEGWRLPVRRYPRLTEIGAIRKCTMLGHERDRPRRYDATPYGGCYTAADIRRVVAHARERHITVVPEIDMPGHMQAAVAAYPELGNTGAAVEVRCHWGISQHILNPQPSTVAFMQNVLEEVLELFPSEFIHIGGDEAHKHEWSESLAAQDRMAALGLKSEAEMQSWFIRQMDQFLAAKGRRLIGWDEILEGGLAEGAAVMSWRGTEGGVKAATQGHDVVMSPTSHTYFDFYQESPDIAPLAIGGMTTLEKAYSFRPIPDELDARHHHHVLGGQGQLWTEYIGSMEVLEYMAFPRVCALAESALVGAATARLERFQITDAHAREDTAAA